MPEMACDLAPSNLNMAESIFPSLLLLSDRSRGRERERESKRRKGGAIKVYDQGQMTAEDGRDPFDFPPSLFSQ